jgi:hypothetical protein
MPYPDGPNKETETVQVWGIEPDSFSRVTGYADTLYWRTHTPDELAEMREDDPRRILNEPLPGEDTTAAAHLFADGLALQDRLNERPGAVLGLHVSVGNERQSDGSIRPMGGGHWWMPRHDVTLTMLPTKGGGIVEPTPGCGGHPRRPGARPGHGAPPGHRRGSSTGHPGAGSRR